MSPRSEEFMAGARERLGAARLDLEAGYFGVAVSAAYYAALYAARAALSEDDRYAKTHSGAWALFNELYVSSGRFDAGLAGEVRRAQEVREQADYDARVVAPEEAERVVAAAERFVAAVATLLGAGR